MILSSGKSSNQENLEEPIIPPTLPIDEGELPVGIDSLLGILHRRVSTGEDINHLKSVAAGSIFSFSAITTRALVKDQLAYTYVVFGRRQLHVVAWVVLR